MTTPQLIEAFIRGTRPPWNDAKRGYDWYGMCAGLTYRTILECGGVVPDGPYSSAWLAYLATTIESKDPRKAPPGAVHYWDYTGLASNGQRARWGHVTLDIYGGGTDTLSATSFAHEVWNTSAGLISVASQSSRAGMVYLGWSRTYGRRNRITITTGSTAGTGGRPLNPGTYAETDADMRTIHSPGRPWANVGAGYVRTISDEAAANTIWPKLELNDRQYDLAVEAALGVVKTQPLGGMVIVAAPNRPKTLLGPGYYRVLNEEELGNAGVLADRVVTGNDRQYDLWVSIALAGQGASFPISAANLSVLSDADVSRLAAAAADEQDRRNRERLGA